MSGFRFKSFEVEHELCAMKVGTDGVLLGAWCDAAGRQRMLDIGTGSGLIALMVAQRNPSATIDAIDIDEGAVMQATINVENNKLSERIRVCKQDFCNLSAQKGVYDLIVSNPPFFTDDTHSPNVGRDTARNASALPFDKLMEGAARVLASDGEFTLVLPAVAAQTIIALGAQFGLYLTRRTDVSDSLDAPVKRVLLAFAHEIRTTERSRLAIHDKNGNRSEEMRRLTQDFYI